jgi:hypothetical protein
MNGAPLSSSDDEPTRSPRTVPPCPACDAIGARWLPFPNDDGAFQCRRCQCVWMPPPPNVIWTESKPARPPRPPQGASIPAHVRRGLNRQQGSPRERARVTVRALSLLRALRRLAERYLSEPGLNRADRSSAVAAPPSHG